MSGWQRIGVVISVLWLVGLPVYVLIDHNLSGAVPPMTPLDLIALFATGKGAYRGGEPDPYWWIIWIAVLGPIALFWLVGWIVLGTVRWVRRGFTGPGR
jgi:hypothetical protein